MGNIAKLYAQVLGAVLLLVGILGFIPGLVSDGNLLGIFAINPLHNVIHLATGLVGLIAGSYAGGRYARTFALVFGIVYALVTVLGFIEGTTVLGLIPVNLADNILHVLIAASALIVYFSSSSQTPATVRA